MTDAKFRKHMLALYGRIYKRWFHDEPGCFYCGEAAEVYDHCPPLALADVTAKGKPKGRIAHWRIRSCHDCNRRLGGRALMSAYDRVSFISRKLEAEYDRKSALWSDEEIAEMGDSFRGPLLARRRAIVNLLNRIRFAQWRDAATDTHPPAEDANRA